MLKKLRCFEFFDSDGFIAGKRFKVTGKQKWIDFKTKKEMGTKIEVVIFVDKTDYGCKEGEVVSNVYEKLVFKVEKELDIPIDSEVRPLNPYCTVYGDYKNQLSIICDDIEIVGK